MNKTTAFILLMMGAAALLALVYDPARLLAAAFFMVCLFGVLCSALAKTLYNSRRTGV